MRCIVCHNFKKYFQKMICQEINNKKILGIVRGPTRRIQNTWQTETVDRELVQKKTGNSAGFWRTSACLFVVLRQFSIL